MPVRGITATTQFKNATLRWAELGLILLTVLVIWLGIAGRLVANRERAMADARHDVSNLSLALAQSTSRLIDTIDQALIAARSSYELDPQHFSFSPWVPVPSADGSRNFQFAIIDRDGILRKSSREPVIAPADLSDRDHFMIHARSRDDVLYISKPVIGRTSNRWGVRLTRAIFTASGEFDGVVVATIDPNYLTQSFASIDVGSQGTIGLARSDGVLLAAPPLSHEELNAAAVGPALLEMASSGNPDDTTMLQGPIGTVERIVSVRVIPNVSLLVFVAESVDDVLVDYLATRRVYLLLGLSMTILIVAIALVSAGSRAQLVQTRRLLAIGLENMDRGIIMLDANRRILVSNRVLAELWGLPPEALSDEPDLETAVALATNPMARAEAESLLHLEKADGEVPRTTEWVHDDDRVIEVSATALEGGGTVATFADVTERKRSEAAAAAARSAAAAAVRAREEFLASVSPEVRTPINAVIGLAERLLNSDLAPDQARFATIVRDAAVTARDAAEAAFRARAGFLAMMSHEIRTPLNAVIGMAGLLLDSPLTQEQIQFATVLRDAGEGLLQIINDILDFSRLEAGALLFENIDFDLQQLVDGVISVMNIKAQERGLRLGAVVDRNAPRFLAGDPGRVRQVLFNIIGNAIKFTEAGEVRLEITATEHTDTERTDTAPAAAKVQLQFAITDTGIGIAREAMPLLFREFSQVDSSISRRFGGTGLGLAICKRLVERMGGTIGVESELGIGSRFHFDLRLGIGAAPAIEPIGPAQLTPPSSRLRILLAEDNVSNQLLAMTLLQRMGHRVDAVANGAEAIEAIRLAPYDLVFMDMMMPLVNGLDATREVRKMPSPAGTIPIVAMTANAFRHDEMACLAAGMNGFISKPISVDRLRDVIGRVLREPGNPPSSNLLPPDVLHELLIEARQHIESARAASNRGDLAAAAAYLTDLQDIVETAGALTLATTCEEAIVAATRPQPVTLEQFRTLLTLLEQQLDQLVPDQVG